MEGSADRNNLLPKGRKFRLLVGEVSRNIETQYRTLKTGEQTMKFTHLSHAASELICRKKPEKQGLLRARLILSKILLSLALSSVLIMMINNELVLLHVYGICSRTALSLKVLTSVFTVALVIFIWVFNYIQLRIFMKLRSIEDLRTAIHVNHSRLLTTIIETVVCAIHPPPVCIGMGDQPDLQPSGIGSLEHKMNYTSVTIAYDDMVTGASSAKHIIRLTKTDSILSVFMFLRLYHIGRFMVLHSKLFRTMISYSLGALAHTKYNFIFIFKSYMAMYKGYFLATFALLFTAIAAWCIYICDRDIVTYQDALWLVGITFFAVGYGDVVPVSRCSQAISVMTGFFGMFCMGISVSILSRYLQLTFDEYCMLSYYMDSDLEKQRQNAAASIIWAAWQEYKSRQGDDKCFRLNTQRKLLKALHHKKDIEYKKKTSRERRERQVPLYDMKEQMKKLTRRTDHLQKRQLLMEQLVGNLNGQLNGLQDKLAILYRLTRKERKTTTTDS